MKKIKNTEIRQRIVRKNLKSLKRESKRVLWDPIKKVRRVIPKKKLRVISLTYSYDRFTHYQPFLLNINHMHIFDCIRSTRPVPRKL
jgi:hypothetical protein